MKRSVVIKEAEMEDFFNIDHNSGKPKGLGPLNRYFYRIDIPLTNEVVYAARVGDKKQYSLRIYSTIENGVSRPEGTDAIRIILFWKNQSVPKMIGMESKVLRTTNWKTNLLNRINSWEEMVGPLCYKCGDPTVIRKGKDKSKFYGCINYPNCKVTINIP